MGATVDSEWVSTMGIPVSEEPTITFSETHLFSPQLFAVGLVLIIVSYIIWRIMRPFAGKDHVANDQANAEHEVKNRKQIK